MELGFYRQYLRTRSMAWRRAKEKDVFLKKNKQHATCSFKELSNFFFYVCTGVKKLENSTYIQPE